MCDLCNFWKASWIKFNFPELSQFVLLGKGLLLDFEEPSEILPSNESNA